MDLYDNAGGHAQLHCTDEDCEEYRTTGSKLLWFYPLKKGFICLNLKLSVQITTILQFLCSLIGLYCLIDFFGHIELSGGIKTTTIDHDWNSTEEDDTPVTHTSGSSMLLLIIVLIGAVCNTLYVITSGMGILFGFLGTVSEEYSYTKWFFRVTVMGLFTFPVICGCVMSLVYSLVLDSENKDVVKPVHVFVTWIGGLCLGSCFQMYFVMVAFSYKLELSRKFGTPGAMEMNVTYSRVRQRAGMPEMESHSSF
eukprot:CAMPEP_0114987868 /NCGR_PEP_ID=MMETSP0216-20121206/9266_1 /TAXON_ID=223996 /ORGANISM="Protocruzia adherens, Strain Boccale" /LENGTH=252 /DNA_ID=CAMNT_0002350553 /DNA_START=43 /DNA_END=801 /DNA_ORIENTATION=-